MPAMHEELRRFYIDNVTLSNKQKQELVHYQEVNRERLLAGLDTLGAARPQYELRQGSMAMGTTIQHPNNDYDIDVAVVFSDADLPSDPLEARKHVCAAVRAGGGSFAKPPEVRTNAVTVWYQAGHHVDLAVYRSRRNIFGEESPEHAGTEWRRRNPDTITEWFEQCVVLCDQQQSLAAATVDPGQLRRVVQLLKMFARQRDECNLPGGLVITVLAVDQFAPDQHRDDLALYTTMCRIADFLRISKDVRNPTDIQCGLTYKDEHCRQLVRFQTELEDSVLQLEPVILRSRSHFSALEAWNKVFNQHSYWEALMADARSASAQLGASLGQAAQGGSLYVTPSGAVFTHQPEGKGIVVPPTRFYGRE